jgi:hypothetical protein
MTRRVITLVASLLLGSATGAAAQVAWDAPTFFAPRPAEDIGLYAWVPEHAAVDYGFAGIWRQHGNISLGVRLGLAGSDNYMIGAEFFGPLHLLGPQSGLLTSWVLGLGATFNDVTQLRMPLGVSVGASLGSTGGVQLMPYVHPRVALDILAFDVGGREQTDTEINFAVDVGADAALGEMFVVRVGATIGGTGATSFGAGIAYRMSRRLIVR